MDQKLTEFEEELKSMAPIMISDDLVDRLAEAMDKAAAEGPKVIYAELPGDLVTLEESLREFVPYGMPENMISRLDEAMSRWHEKVPVEEKVVPLLPKEPARRSSYRPGFRSAAAVALLGAGAALLTSEDPVEVPDVTSRIPVVNAARTAPVVFTPGDARASVVSNKDHGVIWMEGLPVRCFEVEVKNEVLFTNDRGEQLIIAQPKREVMFTPVELD